MSDILNAFAHFSGPEVPAAFDPFSQVWPPAGTYDVEVQDVVIIPSEKLQFRDGKDLSAPTLPSLAFKFKYRVIGPDGTASEVLDLVFEGSFFTLPTGGFDAIKSAEGKSKFTRDVGRLKSILCAVTGDVDIPTASVIPTLEAIRQRCASGDYPTATIRVEVSNKTDKNGNPFRSDRGVVVSR